jgi:hypothetical protein
MLTKNGREGTYSLPLGNVLYGTWYSRTTGVYLREVMTSLLYTGRLIVGKYAGKDEKKGRAG